MLPLLLGAPGEWLRCGADKDGWGVRNYEACPSDIRQHLLMSRIWPLLWWLCV